MPIGLILLVGVGALIFFKKEEVNKISAPSRVSAYTNSNSPTFDLAPSAAQSSLAHTVAILGKEVPTTNLMG